MLPEKEIYMIDTAPSYPKSELRIGEFMKLNNNCQIKVMTKFGRETHPVTKQTLKESVHKSFERLRIDHIYMDSLFTIEVKMIYGMKFLMKS